MTNTTGPVATIRGLAEIVLNVHSMERSLDFYRDLLGLEVISPPERANPVFLRAGSTETAIPAMVVLVQLPLGTADFARPRVLHHLALAITAESFDLVMTELQSRGFAVRTGQHPVIPSRTMYIDDPDGNEVELISPLG